MSFGTSEGTSTSRHLILGDALYYLVDGAGNYAVNSDGVPYQGTQGAIEAVRENTKDRRIHFMLLTRKSPELA